MSLSYLSHTNINIIQYIKIVKSYKLLTNTYNLIILPNSVNNSINKGKNANE